MSWNNDPSPWTPRPESELPTIPDEERCEFMVLPELRCPRKAQWLVHRLGQPETGAKWCFHHSDLMVALWREVGDQAKITALHGREDSL